MSRLPAIAVASILLGLCAGTASRAASAEEQIRTINSGPVNHCQATLPVFDGQIRKRPLAVVNEGNSNAFVTCSLTTIGPRFLTLSESLQFFVSYNGPLPSVDITCTTVGGVQGGTGGVGSEPQFNPRSATFERGAEPESFTFLRQHFNNDIMPDVVSFQCALPPGAAIHDMHITMLEDIGE